LMNLKIKTIFTTVNYLQQLQSDLYTHYQSLPQIKVGIVQPVVQVNRLNLYISTQFIKGLSITKQVKPPKTVK